MLVSLPCLIPVFGLMIYVKLIPLSAAKGDHVFPVVVAEGYCLAVNNLHRGTAQAVRRWRVTAFFRVLT